MQTYIFKYNFKAKVSKRQIKSEESSRHSK